MARYTRTRILRDQLKARTEEKWELLHESQRWERTARELAQVCEAQATLEEVLRRVRRTGDGQDQHRMGDGRVESGGGL